MLYSDANKFDTVFNIFMFYLIRNFVRCLTIMYVGGPVNSTIRVLFSFSSTFAFNWKSESKLSEAQCRSYPFHCYFPNPNFFMSSSQFLFLALIFSVSSPITYSFFFPYTYFVLFFHALLCSEEEPNPTNCHRAFYSCIL